MVLRPPAARPIRDAASNQMSQAERFGDVAGQRGSFYEDAGLQEGKVGPLDPERSHGFGLSGPLHQAPLAFSTRHTGEKRLLHVGQVRLTTDDDQHRHGQFFGKPMDVDDVETCNRDALEQHCPNRVGELAVLHQRDHAGRGIRPVSHDISGDYPVQARSSTDGTNDPHAGTVRSTEGCVVKPRDIGNCRGHGLGCGTDWCSWRGARSELLSLCPFFCYDILVTDRSFITPAFYEARTATFRETHQDWVRRSRRISNLRGMAFGTFVIAGGFSLFGSAGTIGLGISVAGLLAFVSFVVLHARVIAAEERAAHFVRVNEDATLRVSPGGFSKLPQKGERFVTPGHPYAKDLDIFGDESLFQRLSVAHMARGEECLAGFLMRAATVEEIRRRQELVRTLAPLLELRQEFEVLSRGARPRSTASEGPNELADFVAWAEEKGTSLRLTYAIVGLPVVTVLLLAAASLLWLPSWVPMLAVGVQALFWMLQRSRIIALLRVLPQAERVLPRLGPMFALLEGSVLAPQLFASAERPSLALEALGRVTGWFEVRHNGLIYPLVNLLFLWDLQCVRLFEDWRARHGVRLRAWVDILAEVEAISSLAGLAHDEPESCFLELSESTGHLSLEGVGHPLIAPGKRVYNDMPPLTPGNGLLVTGSNMSGKSTFLRAIGLAVVLGQAGGPVCARRLVGPPLRVFTSMRITDRLQEGVSHFYAELLKLKLVLDASKEPEPLLFLLDEILHGTNSRERHIGARFVLAELLRRGALGAVSTHDLGLCELEENSGGRLLPIHFRENFDSGEMSFDYHLRPGPVTTGNALRLMASIGIPVIADASCETLDP